MIDSRQNELKELVLLFLFYIFSFTLKEICFLNFTCTKMF